MTASLLFGGVGSGFGSHLGEDAPFTVVCHAFFPWADTSYFMQVPPGTESSAGPLGKETLV